MATRTRTYSANAASGKRNDSGAMLTPASLNSTGKNAAGSSSYEQLKQESHRSTYAAGGSSGRPFLPTTNNFVGGGRGNNSDASMIKFSSSGGFNFNGTAISGGAGGGLNNTWTGGSGATRSVTAYATMRQAAITSKSPSFTGNRSMLPASSTGGGSSLSANRPASSNTGSVGHSSAGNRFFSGNHRPMSGTGVHNNHQFFSNSPTKKQGGTGLNNLFRNGAAERSTIAAVGNGAAAGQMGNGYALIGNAQKHVDAAAVGAIFVPGFGKLEGENMIKSILKQNRGSPKTVTASHRGKNAKLQGAPSLSTLVAAATNGRLGPNGRPLSASEYIAERYDKRVRFGTPLTSCRPLQNPFKPVENNTSVMAKPPPSLGIDSRSNSSDRVEGVGMIATGSLSSTDLLIVPPQTDSSSGRASSPASAVRSKEQRSGVDSEEADPISPPVELPLSKAKSTSDLPISGGGDSHVSISPRPSPYAMLKNSNAFSLDVKTTRNAADGTSSPPDSACSTSTTSSQNSILQNQGAISVNGNAGVVGVAEASASPGKSISGQRDGNFVAADGTTRPPLFGKSSSNSLHLDTSSQLVQVSTGDGTAGRSPSSRSSTPTSHLLPSILDSPGTGGMKSKQSSAPAVGSLFQQSPYNKSSTDTDSVSSRESSTTGAVHSSSNWKNGGRSNYTSHNSDSGTSARKKFNRPPSADNLVSVDNGEKNLKSGSSNNSRQSSPVPSDTVPGPPLDGSPIPARGAGALLGTSDRSSPVYLFSSSSPTTGRKSVGLFPSTSSSSTAPAGEALQEKALFSMPVKSFSVGSLSCRSPTPVYFYSDRMEYSFSHPYDRTTMNIIVSYRDMQSLGIVGMRFRFKLQRKLAHFLGDFDPQNPLHMISVELTSMMNVMTVREKLLPLMNQLSSGR